MKKIIVTVISIVLLYVAFVCGQVFTLKTQQLGFQAEDGHFESTVNVGGTWHRYDYEQNKFEY